MCCNRFTAFALLWALGIAHSITPARAQQRYPTRPIHIVVPFPAGGPSDVLTRLMGERMSADFGEAIVVDNRPGANTVIGAQLVAKAAPDGYTLLMAIDSTLVMNQYLYSRLSYDPIKDFAPISLTAENVGLLVVNAASGMKTANDLIAKAKAQPGKLNCGAGTITTKLTCFLFDEKAGIDSVLLSYNGSAEVAQGVLTRSADFVFDGSAAELPLIRSGNLRALAKLERAAVSADARSADAQRRGGHRSGRRDGMGRPCRAARHAACHRRQACGGGGQNPQRPSVQGQGRSGGDLSGEQHAE